MLSIYVKSDHYPFIKRYYLKSSFCLFIIISFSLSHAIGQKHEDKQANAQDTTIKTNAKSVMVLPIPSFDRSKGVGLGVIGVVFLKSKNTKYPTSRMGGGGMATTKGNWYLGLFEQFYLDEDNWRITGGQLLGNKNFQTYTTSPDFGETEIPYNDSKWLFYLQVKRQVLKKFYAGFQFQVSQTQTTFMPPGRPDSIVNENQFSIGFPFSYDTRNYVTNPSKGLYVNLTLYALPEWLGNLDSYNKINTNLNYYFSPGKNKILASRFAVYRAIGSVPFTGQRVIGGTDIRGYSKGAYRGNETYSIQSELRWSLLKRFGVVGFAGIALANDADGNLSPLLPGIGGGLRYLLIKAQRINIGIDAAVGHADYGIYFRLGEAF